MAENIKTAISQLYDICGRRLAFITVAAFLIITICLIRNIIKKKYYLLRWYWNARECVVICACLMVIMATFCDDPSISLKAWLSDSISVNFIPETKKETKDIEIPVTNEQGSKIGKVMGIIEHNGSESERKYEITAQIIPKYESESFQTTLRMTFISGMFIVFYLLLETFISFLLIIRKIHSLLQYTRKHSKRNIYTQYTNCFIVYILFLLACISRLKGSIVAMSIFVIYISIKRLDR